MTLDDYEQILHFTQMCSTFHVQLYGLHTIVSPDTGMAR